MPVVRRRSVHWILGTVAATVILIAGASFTPAGARQQPYFITPTWGRLSSAPGWRPDPFAQGVWQHHWGIDIAAPFGTPVLASAAGTVQYVGTYGGYGPVIYLVHAGGWATLYAHLSSIYVRPGQQVPQASIIGAVGNYGHSTGPHLHFEIRYHGIPVNPLPYLLNSGQ